LDEAAEAAPTEAGKEALEDKAAAMEDKADVLEEQADEEEGVLAK
jgi:hypothetical protein